MQTTQLNSEVDYEFGEHADAHSASDQYAERFSGSTGRWFLKVQADILRSLVSRVETDNCLDVGGGHAQVVQALNKLVPEITVLVSCQEAALQLYKPELKAKAQIVVDKLIANKIEDTSYQLVTCFRILSHTANWRDLIAELTRLSKQRVIVEFPIKVSFNLLEPILFKFKKNLEGNTRRYLSFTKTQVIQEFEDRGFKLLNYRAQYFFPMVLHRKLKMPFFSATIELIPKVLGLTRLFGTPIIAEFGRKEI